MDVKNGCFAADCGNQKTQNIDNAKRCQISKKVKEEVDGWFDMLPGMTMPMKS